jgi:hypothetical protein
MFLAITYRTMGSLKWRRFRQMTIAFTWCSCRTCTRFMSRVGASATSFGPGRLTPSGGPDHFKVVTGAGGRLTGPKAGCSRAVLLLAVLLVSWNGTAWSGAVAGGAVSSAAAKRSDVEWRESRQVSGHHLARVATFTVPWHGLATAE